MVSDDTPLQPLLKSVNDVLSWLDRRGVPAVFIGGLAASILGRPRVTRDVDILIELSEEGWDEFVLSGEQYGLRRRIQDCVDFARKSRVFLMRHVASGIDVDLIVAGLDFEREVIARAIKTHVGGMKIPLATVEDLIIMKSIAQRGRDTADIEALIDTHANLDWERVQAWAKEFSLALDRSDIVDLLTRLRRRREPLGR